MPQTFRRYGVWEVALSARDEPNNGVHERVQAGDIIAIRRQLGYVGRKERSSVVWILLTGLDDSDMYPLIHPVEEGNDVFFDKRRYCIPLTRLKQAFPSLDMARITDRQDAYQPFCLLDEDTGYMLTMHPPFHVQGLVYDKSMARWI
ncbi:hypothetical protein COW64_25825 [bacterium (Candidatus Blackallbacteria) CG18_big_fil_WC_8_21_14_2_50_49_26]|nr:MAG: hypothetical protein COW64_25825 [bacterium (Candidatus Blackallbacteria) CG18_big_fil_WC_8_21_14_2_50_49_26]